MLEPEDDELVLAEYARLERLHLRVGEPTPVACAHRIVAAARRRMLAQAPSLASRRTQAPSGVPADEPVAVGA